MTSVLLDPAWPGVTDERLDVGGREVRVLRADGPDSGTPHLLVHGLGGSSVTWVEVMAGLAESGPVAAIDLPGFGRTPVRPGERLTMGRYARFVLATLDALGWDRVVLHGNSMGGLVAVLLAARQPWRVDRLVLVSPALPPPSPLGFLLPSRATLDGMLPIAMSGLSTERRGRAMLGLIFSDPESVSPDLLRLMAREFRISDPAEAQARRDAGRAAVRSLGALWASPGRVWQAIDAVTAPTLLLGGTADALVPARVLRQVLARRPDWQGHLLDDRRHALMLESPEEYVDLVRAWASAAG